MEGQEGQNAVLESKILAYFEGRGLTEVAAAFVKELEDRRNIHAPAAAAVNDLEDKWEEYQAKQRDDTVE